MTNRPGLESTFNSLLDLVARKLANPRITKKPPSLQILSGDNVGLVHFQRSQDSNARNIRFTVDLGVVLGALVDGAAKTPGMMSAHVRQRLGRVLSTPSDRWWNLDESTNLDELSSELADHLATAGLPFIERLLDPREVLELWESGRAPGLTATQRDRLLEKLRASLGE